MSELTGQEVFAYKIHSSLVFIFCGARGGGGEGLLLGFHIVLVFGRAFHLKLGAFKIAIAHITVQIEAFAFFNIGRFCIFIHHFGAAAVLVQGIKFGVVGILDLIVYNGLGFVQLYFNHHKLLFLFACRTERFVGGKVFNKKDIPEIPATMRMSKTMWIFFISLKFGAKLGQNKEHDEEVTHDLAQFIFVLAKPFRLCILFDYPEV